jgi:5-methylcytosine-specific restriction endonuclease McrA
MSNANSNRHAPKPGRPFNDYQFARTCALEWCRINGMPLEEPASAQQIARKLGLRPEQKGAGYAKKAIVQWHNTAIRTNKDAPVVLEDDFYNSQAWRAARYRALRNCNGRCMLCGSPPAQHSLHVDHIKPRSLFPALALEPSNLQVLCRDCNLGKSNKDTIDWRTARSERADVEGDYSDRAISKMLRQIA